MELVEKLQALGLELPQAAAPAANYVPYVISGNQLFVAGQIPFLNGQSMHLGRLGDDLAVEDGVKAAQACALNLLEIMEGLIADRQRRARRKLVAAHGEMYLCDGL